MRRANKIKPNLIGIAFFLLFNFNTQSQIREKLEKRQNELFPIKKERKSGYVSNTGRMLIRPKFDYAYDFSEGLALVEVGHKWGFIDQTGQYVIKPKFDTVRAFSPDLYLQKIGENWFYTDNNGNIIFQSSQGKNKIKYFYEGLANVELFLKWGYIDRTGKFVIKPKFDYAGHFSEGLGEVIVGQKWGYIDNIGNYVINPQFDFARPFSDGFATVWAGGKCGYINKAGEYVIERKFDTAGDFSDGRAWVMVGKKWGLIEQTGKYLIYPQFDDVREFSEGLANVKTGGKWGYIEKSGQYVINPKFDNVWPFSEGLAGVEVGKKWGYIDNKGNYAANPQFDFVRSYSEGMAAVGEGNAKGSYKWGYIDKTGKYVVNPKFDWGGDFSDGLAPVWIRGNWGYIDKTGKYVYKPKSGSLTKLLQEGVILAVIVGFIHMFIPGLLKLVSIKANDKAAEICQSLVKNNYPDVKMMLECTIPAFTMPRGILVLLPDRLVYYPVEKGEKLEMPIDGIRGIKIKKSRFFGGGTVEIKMDGSRIHKFRLGLYSSGIFRAVFQKVAPLLMMQEGR